MLLADLAWHNGPAFFLNNHHLASFSSAICVLDTYNWQSAQGGCLLQFWNLLSGPFFKGLASLSCKASSLVFSAYFLKSWQRCCSVRNKSVFFQNEQQLFDISVFLITLKLRCIFVSGITLCYALLPHFLSIFEHCSHLKSTSIIRYKIRELIPTEQEPDKTLWTYLISWRR